LNSGDELHFKDNLGGISTRGACLHDQESDLVRKKWMRKDKSV